MGSVTGYTAAKTEALMDEQIIDAEISGDNLHLITRGGSTIDAGSVRGATGATGPSGGISDAPSDDGLYLRKNALWVPVTPNKSWVVAPGPASEQVISSISGVDWTQNSGGALDLAFTKNSDDSWMQIRVNWSVHINTAAFCTTYAGVRVDGATDHWTPVGHQCNLISHFEFEDVIALFGLSAGAHSLRARMKVVASSEPARNDVGDHFKIEYEEVYV